MGGNHNCGSHKVLDVGLQSERTGLAWSRTALAFAVVGALLLHASTAKGNRLEELPGFLALSAATVTYLFSIVRYRAVARHAKCNCPTTSATAIRTLTGLTAFIACSRFLLLNC